MNHTKALIDALQPFVLANSSEEFVTLVVRSGDITKARTAIKQALAAPVQPVSCNEAINKALMDAATLLYQGGHKTESAACNAALLMLMESRPAPVQEPLAWVDLLEQAEQIVRGKFLWKRFIDGTPLANDIPVWMADFAQQHTTPPATQRQWVGLTDEEYAKAEKCVWAVVSMDDTERKANREFYCAIEAKLKEKNT